MKFDAQAAVDAGLLDPMTAAFMEHMRGPAQACDAAALDVLFPRKEAEMADRVEVTPNDQRRWEGIVRDWDIGSPTVLTQINEKLHEQYPEEWSKPYKGFVYGFRGMLSGQDTLGVCGQWVAYRAADKLHLYASVPGAVAGVYRPGGSFDVSCLFPREELRDPAGFADLWEAVRESRERLVQLMDHWDILGLSRRDEAQGVA